MDRIKNISKLLSLVLRHRPSILSLELDENGYVDVVDLIIRVQKYGYTEFTIDMLFDIVKNNDKKRFEFFPDNDNKNLKIRACQGHSIKAVDLQLVESWPPSILYHGTSNLSLSNIFEKGILKMGRNHVHLSTDKETAIKVGSRHGKPSLLLIKSDLMHKDGIKFYLSKNKVWLTDYVDPKYLTLLTV